MSLFEELKRRNVFKVGAAYLVLAWIVIQFTDTAVPALHLPEWVNSLVFLLGAIGFPFALFFAWAFEITPEGVKKESEVERDDSIAPQTGKKLEFAIIGMLIIGLGYFFWESRIDDARPNATTNQTTDTSLTEGIEKTSATNPASIAVLAFSDLSPKGDQEYFSDGIAEEILNVLVKIDSLEVSSRTSSFQFKGREIGIPEIAKSLNVRHILEGSVRKSGETIRITAQLIDAENDKHLWSETYDRPLEIKNIFAIQDEISQAIVKALSSAMDIQDLTVADVIPTTNNLSAYDLYLEARPLYQARSQLNKADDLLKKAIELDPNFAKAWEMRAAIQMLNVDYGFTSESREKAEQRSFKFAEHAISINPESALAIAVIAQNKSNAVQEMRTQYDITTIVKDFDRALDIEPRNASALNWRGLVYMMTGNLKMAIEDFKACNNFEPYYEPCIENYLQIIANIKSDQFALNAVRKTLNLGITKLEYANLFLLARMHKELLFKAATNNPRALRGWHRHDELYQAFLHPQQNHQELSNDIIAFVKDHSDRDISTINLILLGLGHYQSQYYVGAEWGSSVKDYRQSPQFKNYIRQSGILKYWQDSDFPPQCRPLPESKIKDEFECD